VQADFDRAGRGAQQQSHMVGVESFDVAEEEDAVEFREALDAVANLGARLGPLRKGVCRLAPARACEGRQYGLYAARREVFKGHHSSSLAGTLDRKTLVDEDPIKPGPEFRVPLEGIQGLANSKQSILQGIRTVLVVGKKATGNGMHATAVRSDEEFKCARVPRANAGQQFSFRLHRKPLSFLSCVTWTSLAPPV